MQVCWCLYVAEIHTCGGPLCHLCGWSYNWYVLLPIATTCMQQHLATHSHLVRWLWLRKQVILRVILRIILGWWWCRTSRHHRLLSHYRLRLVIVMLWLQQLFMMLIRGSTVIGRNWLRNLLLLPLCVCAWFWGCVCMCVSEYLYIQKRET